MCTVNTVACPGLTGCGRDHMLHAREVGLSLGLLAGCLVMRSPEAVRCTATVYCRQSVNET